LPYAANGTPNKIAVYGGWGIFDMRADMWIYKIDENEWIDPEFDYDIPRWNHAAHMYQHPPMWKYFVFGGSTGTFDESEPRTLGSFTDTLHVFDVSQDQWTGVVAPLEIGEKAGPLAKPVKPQARDSC